MSHLYRWSATALVITFVLWAIWRVDSHRPETRVKLFCAYNRVFIEFHEQNNIWGTVWLDNNGMPVECGDMPLDEKVNYKGTI